MKYILILILIFALNTCSSDQDMRYLNYNKVSYKSGASFRGTGTLTIKNNSDITLEFLEWDNTYFTPDTVYDGYRQTMCACLKPGSTFSQKVKSGINYIYFTPLNNIYIWRTYNTISVNEDSTTDFNFSNCMQIEKVKNWEQN